MTRLVRWLIGKGGPVTGEAAGKYDEKTLKAVLDEAVRPRNMTTWVS